MPLNYTRDKKIYIGAIFLKDWMRLISRPKRKNSKDKNENQESSETNIADSTPVISFFLNLRSWLSGQYLGLRDLLPLRSKVLISPCT